MRTRTILTFIAILATAAPAAAGQSTPSPSIAAAPAKADKPICRSEEETGSRFSKRVCHTKSQWNAIAAEAQTGFEASRRPRGSFDQK